MRIFMSLILTMALVFGTMTYVAADDTVDTNWVPVQGEGYVPADLVLK